MRKNIIGLILGFVIGNVAITYAQQLYLPDPNWGVCWVQDNTLPEINSYKWRLSYNGQTPFDITPSCTGNQPYDCVANTKVPIALQVGTLNVKIDAAVVQVDGTIGSYINQLDSNVTFGTIHPDPQPSKGKSLGLKKLLEALLSFFGYSTLGR